MPFFNKTLFNTIIIKMYDFNVDRYEKIPIIYNYVRNS